MGPKQGWFESDDDYQRRVALEADERTIEDSTGDAPSRGFFETDDDYRQRVAEEANERRIEDSTGEAPSRGWFESEDDYRDRIEEEANERTIEDSSGSAPEQGWFESDEDYGTRVREEANERLIEDESGRPPKPGWFEGDHDYRSRIAHEAREFRASGKRDRGSDSDEEVGSDSDAYSSSSSSHETSPSGSAGPGIFIAALVLLFIAAAIMSGGRERTTSLSPQPTYIQPNPTTQTIDRQDLERRARIAPSAFPGLPPNIARDLTAQGCMIPQAYYLKGLHNVISGDFMQPGQHDWAVMCARGDEISVVLYPGGATAEAVTLYGPYKDQLYVDNRPNEGLVFGYNRSISGVGKDFILFHYQAYGGPTPPPIDHHGIDIACCEKASQTLYWFEGAWHELQGAD